MDSPTNNQSAQGLQIPPEIRTFLESLLQDAGMTSLDDGMREEMIKELFARLDSYITSTIIQNLPQEHIEPFVKMTEENRPQSEIQAYLQEKMPNAQDVFAKAFMEFRDMYLGNSTVARGINNQATDDVAKISPS